MLRPTKAEESDDTIVCEDEYTVQPTPSEHDDHKDNNKEVVLVLRNLTQQIVGIQRLVTRKEHLGLLGMSYVHLRSRNLRGLNVQNAVAAMKH